MKRVFKVGDRVFDIRMGWGKVVKEYDCEVIDVKFKKDLTSYYVDGTEVGDDYHSLLSFTKYELKGFSQERPMKDQVD
jgi:hypothetical protein